jgi:hypothetical protein
VSFLVAYLSVVALGAFLLGVFEQQPDSGTVSALLVWPVVVAMAAVAFPFIGLYHLGEYIRIRRSAP